MIQNAVLWCCWLGSRKGIQPAKNWVVGYWCGYLSGQWDNEWKWHQLGHMQMCTSPRTDNHASTPPLSCLQVGRPSCCPTNSIKALKAINSRQIKHIKATSIILSSQYRELLSEPSAACCKKCGSRRDDKSLNDAVGPRNNSSTYSSVPTCSTPQASLLPKASVIQWYRYHNRVQTNS